MENKNNIPGLFDIANNYFLLFYAVPCYLMYASLTSIMFLKNTLTFFLPLAGVVSIVGPLYLLNLRSPKTFKDQFTLYFPPPQSLILPVIITASAIIPLEAFSVIFQKNLVNNTDYISFLVTIKSKGLPAYILIGVHLVVVAPLSEELLFRGYIQRILQRNMSATIAVILAGLIFGIAHLNILIIPSATVMGMLFGYLMIRTGSLIVPTLGHAIFNAFSFTMLSLSTVEELQSKDVQYPDWRLVLISMLVFVIATAIFESKRGRKKEGGDI